jgi:APA family basic amino acid/polyamine antiporter
MLSRRMSNPIRPNPATYSPQAGASEPGMRRQLGLASAVAAVAGECIAVGIFLTPAGMAKSLGSPLWLLVVWLAVAAMTMSGALCYGELAGRYPRAGGSYVYLHEIFGSRVAFLYGWMCLLVLDPGLTAALATGIAGYVAYIFHWSTPIVKLVAVVIICSLCLLNARSMRVSAGLLRWITWLKLGVLGLLVVWAMAFRLGSWSNFLPFVAQRHGSAPLVPALGGAIVAAFFSFGGWWDVSKIAGEIRDPVRTLPRALTLGVVVVTAVYLSVSAAFVYLIPIQNVGSDETFVAQAGAVLFGPVGGIVFATIVIVCVLGGLAAFVIAAPRVYYAMAKDGLFVDAVARLHPRFGTPANAIAIQAVIASLLALLGTFPQILGYFIFSAVAFLGLTVSGLFVVRARKQAWGAAVLTPGYPATPVAFLLLVVLLLALLLMHGAKEPLIGVAVVLAGLPVHAVLESKRKRALLEALSLE